MSQEEVVVKDIAPGTIAYLRCRGSWRQLPEVLAKLDEHMAGNRLKPEGPASGIYHNTPAEVDVRELIWEVFYPVKPGTPRLDEDSSGFGVKKVPGKRMATLIHRGPYRQAGSSYARLEEWIEGRGLQVSGPAEETYLSKLAGSRQEQEIEIGLPVQREEA